MPGAGCSTVRPQPQTAQNPLDATDAHARELQALQEALRRLLLPMAQLGVARGLPYAAVEELFKQAYVQAAGDAHHGPSVPADQDLRAGSPRTVATG